MFVPVPRLFRPTFVLSYVCPILSLSRSTFVPSYVCPILRLSRPTFVPSHVCPILLLSRSTFVPSYVCPVPRLSRPTFVPSYVCPVPRLSHPTFVPSHVCPVHVCPVLRLSRPTFVRPTFVLVPIKYLTPAWSRLRTKTAIASTIRVSRRTLRSLPFLPKYCINQIPDVTEKLPYIWEKFELMPNICINCTSTIVFCCS